MSKCRDPAIAVTRHATSFFLIFEGASAIFQASAESLEASTENPSDTVCPWWLAWFCPLDLVTAVAYLMRTLVRTAALQRLVGESAVDDPSVSTSPGTAVLQCATHTEATY